MKKNNANRGIVRIDIEHSEHTGATHGWEVRIRRRHKNENMFFSDRKYGGQAGALTAARKFRDKLDRTIPPFSRHEIAEILSKRNTSGVVGVRLVGEAAWVASWSPKPRERKIKSFSIARYGEERAFELALKARHDGVLASEE